MFKVLFAFSCCLVSFHEINSLPLMYNPVQIIPIRVLDSRTNEIMPHQQRFVWNLVGDLITSSGFLPIEINVPDTVNTIYNGAVNGAQTVVSGIQTIAGNVISNIPIINRLTSPDTPRPLKLIVLVPVESPHLIQQSQQKVLLPIGNYPYQTLDNVANTKLNNDDRNDAKLTALII